MIKVKKIFSFISEEFLLLFLPSPSLLSFPFLVYLRNYGYQWLSNCSKWEELCNALRGEVWKQTMQGVWRNPRPGGAHELNHHLKALSNPFVVSNPIVEPQIKQAMMRLEGKKGDLTFSFVFKQCKDCTE